MRLGEVDSVICSFFLSVAARKNCLSRSVPEIHQHVAGTFSSQQTNKLSLLSVEEPFQSPQAWCRSVCMGTERVQLPGSSGLVARSRCKQIRFVSNLDEDLIIIVVRKYIECKR